MDGSGLQETIHQVVTQCLDSSEGVMVRENLEESYTVLIHAASTASSAVFAPYDPCWLETQCDLYRALIVTSLLLRLQHYRQYDQEKCQCLEDSVERCFALLKIMIGTTEDLPGTIPPSRYNILNSLLLEPLVPLSKPERERLWLSNDEAADINAGDEDNDGEGDTNHLMLPDKKQLALEELQLLSMARRPIPEPARVSFSPEIEFSAPLPKRPSDVLMQHRRVQLFRCGVLLVQQQHEGTYSLLFSSKTTVQQDVNADDDTTLRVQIMDGGDSNPNNSIQISIVDKHNRQVWIDAFEVALQHARMRDELRCEAKELWDRHPLNHV